MMISDSGLVFGPPVDKISSKKFTYLCRTRKI